MKFLFPLVALLLSASLCDAQSSAVTIQKTFHIASTGGWDYLAVSPVADLLYVSHGTQVNILNKTTGDSVGVITGAMGVHGIAFAPGSGKGFVSNGRLNNAFVFDLKTNRVTGSIKTGENPDAIFYEPFAKRIVVCNGRSKDVSIIDPVTEKVVATIALGGAPETAVSDGKGKMYIAIEDKNEIAVIDMKSLKLVNHFATGAGEEPAGLAFDAADKLLFAGCGNKRLVIMNTSGKIVQTLPIGDHCDGVVFDNQSAYASCGDGILAVVRRIAGNGNSYAVENIATQRGARTITVDPKTHLLYLPTADFKPQTTGEKGRPPIVPGTFHVLVVGKG